VGTKVEEKKALEQEKVMNEFGLANLDDDLEVTHEEYKESSEKKKRLIESTNQRI